MEIKTAATMGLESLYHYQRFNAERLIQILSTHTIYCPNPSKFNDPWDCKPWFNTAALNDPVVREEHIEWFDAVGRKYSPELSEGERQRRIEIMRRDTAVLERMINECSRGIAQAIDARYRVYCLTTNPICTLMWSHYTDNHQGICLEFDVKNIVICSAQKVEYRDEYPLLTLGTDDYYQNLLPLLTKSTVWDYEDEFRLIAQERKNAVEADTLMTEDNLLRLPPGALKSIIVGCMAPPTTVRRLREITDKYGPGCQLGELFACRTATP